MVRYCPHCNRQMGLNHLPSDTFRDPELCYMDCDGFLIEWKKLKDKLLAEEKMVDQEDD